MSDAITVEVDGELGEPDYLPERPRPAWGLPAAVVVIVLLLAGLAWTLLSDGGSTNDANPTPAPTGAPNTGPPTTASAASSTTDPTPPVEEPEPDLTDPVDASRAALRAWGEFAATGDLSIVEPFFDVDGPQYAQLAAEASDIDRNDGVPYDVSTEQPAVTVDGDAAHVKASVIWRRAGEPDQRYEWSIELHRTGDQWRLWTVRTVGT